MITGNPRVAEDAENMAFGDEYAPVLKSNPSHKELILQSLDNDCHTMRQICQKTGLTNETVNYELGILQGIEVYHRPGPPVTTYWRLGQQPKDNSKVYIGAGGKVFVIQEEKPDKDFSEEIARKNEELKKQQEENARLVLRFPPKKAIKKSEKKSEKKAVDEEVIKVAEITPLNTGNNEPVFSDSDVEELFSNVTFTPAGAGLMIPLSLLLDHPDNPRTYINTSEDAFLKLVESIKAKGILEPLIVRPNPDGNFTKIAGHRRAKAAGSAGLTEVPCILKSFADVDEEIEVMLIENMQRKDLTRTQEAKAFEKLLKKQDVHSIARKTGETQTYISQSQLLLKLAPEIQLLIDRDEIQFGSAIALASLDFGQQKKLLVRVRKMKVKDVEALCKNVKAKVGQRPASIERKTRERVTRDDEKFTRSGAIKSLKEVGGMLFSTYNLTRAFDDVCLDSCLETKDETFCHSCPVPRFIEAALRRANKENQ